MISSDFKMTIKLIQILKFSFIITIIRKYIKISTNNMLISLLQLFRLMSRILGVWTE